MKKITMTALFSIIVSVLYAQNFDNQRDSIMALQKECSEQYLKYKDKDPLEADKYLEKSNRYFREAVDCIVDSMINNQDQAEKIIAENLFMFDRDAEILSKIRGIVLSNPNFSGKLRNKIEELYRQANDKILVGQQAPEFTLTNAEGEQVSLSDFKGKYIWLNFWASWCAPCRAKMRFIAQNYDTIKNDEMVIVSVSFDEVEKLWLNASNNDGISWVSLRNAIGFGGTVKEQYKIESLPTTFLIDKKMKIIMQNPNLEDIMKIFDKKI